MFEAKFLSNIVIDKTKQKITNTYAQCDKRSGQFRFFFLSAVFLECVRAHPYSECEKEKQSKTKKGENNTHKTREYKLPYTEKENEKNNEQKLYRGTYITSYRVNNITENGIISNISEY